MKIAKKKKVAQPSSQKTVIISLVLILVAVMIAFNLEKFTGHATKISETKIYLSADPEIADQGDVVVDKGSSLYITADPGSSGCSKAVTIYDVNSIREIRVKTYDLNCGAQCNPGIIASGNINVYNNWEGKYCARVKDYASGNEVQSCFTVR